MCILDLLNGYAPRAAMKLALMDDLGDDLLALKGVLENWDKTDFVFVGESGTLCRFIQMVIWKQGLNKTIVKYKTLEKRNICDNPEIATWSQKELLTLDNQTSQWASAAVLCGDPERLKNPPFKLQVSYDAVDGWSPEGWEARLDQTIYNQALAFDQWMNGKTHRFIAEQAEDYCFARAFCLIDKENGLCAWPSLVGHESNRIEEMEEAILEYENGAFVQSLDHRVIQAIALKSLMDGLACDFSDYSCVKKSWTRFWDFHAKYNLSRSD
jgi:hypothetical protein